MGTTFTVDASTTNTLVTHAYNAPGTYRVGVKYMDNDGQWSSVSVFPLVISNIKRYFYVKDHLGNIRQTLDESKTVVAAQDYYPYGETLRGYNSSLSNEKYKFTEKERDIETNLDYFGSRYYDSQLGIWGQVDPKTFENYSDGMSGEAINLLTLAGKSLGMSDKQLAMLDVAQMILLTKTIVSELNTTEALMFLSALNDCESLTQDIKDVVEDLSKEKTKELKKELEERKKKNEEQSKD